MAEKDPIVYRYKPGVPGAGFPEVPQRDLRQSDVDALIGEAIRHVTQPEVPDPVYVLVEHHDKAAEQPAKKADDKKGTD